MGQYYRIYLKSRKTNEESVFNSYVDGKFHGQKLMEQSWCGSPVCDAICSMLYKNPMITAWVGDYSDEVDEIMSSGIHDIVWYSGKAEGLASCPFSMDGKFLVNHTKKQYLDFDSYKKKSAINFGCIHPLPILTSAGNGLGSGDYSGSCETYAGEWMLNEISIEDSIPDGYSKLEVFFIE